MTDPVDPKNICVAPAAPGDEEAFASFRCSTGPEYERVVEAYVRDKALELSLQRDAELTLFTLLENGRLVGCVGHRRALLTRERVTRPGVVGFESTLIALVAVSVDDRGRRLPSGMSLAQLLMNEAIRDGCQVRGPSVFAYVARLNHRGRNLCESVGLRTQMKSGTKLLLMSGTFEPPSGNRRYPLQVSAGASVSHPSGS